MSEHLSVAETAIPGLFKVGLVVHGDERGWFKENYQRQKLLVLGLPDFKIVQNNISFNAEKGVLRGIHAEPWEKYISVATGSVFGAWVDLRAGTTFGKVVTAVISPEVAVFVPRGVANAYQTLEENVVYTYLVNEHWSPEVRYLAVNPFDPQLAISWPVSKDAAIVSEKDVNNPLLQDVKPVQT